MSRGLIEDRRRSPIEEILATRQGPPTEESAYPGRYGDGKREQREREDVRESYLAMDVRLRSGEYRGFFYFDLTGSPLLDADHTTLTVPFRDEALIIRGYRLLATYRAILHHSVDVLEESHRSEFAAESGNAPVIASIEVMKREVAQ